MTATDNEIPRPDGAAFVISRYPPAVGGTENRAARLAAELTRRHWKITVLTRYHGDAPRSENAGGVRVFRLGPYGGGLVGSLRFYVQIFLKLVLLRKDYGVIQNFLLSTLTPLCCAAGVLLGKQVFVSLGGVGVRGGLNDASGTGRFSGAKKSLLSLFSPTFITPNDDGLEELAQSGLPPARAKLIPSPAPTAVFTPPSGQERETLRRELGFEGETFLFAGRFVKEKNLPLLLEAWAIFSAAHPQARLVLAGDGPEKAGIERLLADPGLRSSIRFAGVAQDVAAYYRAADFFVLPSDTEGMSNALLEAMSCGLIPLVKDISGCAPVIDGETGLKAPRAATAAQFAALFARAAALDSTARKTISSSAARLMREKYSLEKIAEQYLQLYNGA